MTVQGPLWFRYNGRRPICLEGVVNLWTPRSQYLRVGCSSWAWYTSGF